MSNAVALKRENEIPFELFAASCLLRSHPKPIDYITLATLMGYFSKENRDCKIINGPYSIFAIYIEEVDGSIKFKDNVSLDMIIYRDVSKKRDVTLSDYIELCQPMEIKLFLDSEVVTTLVPSNITSEQSTNNVGREYLKNNRLKNN